MLNCLSTLRITLFLLLARSNLAFITASTKSTLQPRLYSAQSTHAPRALLAFDSFSFPPASRETLLKHFLFNTDPWTSTFPTYSSATSPKGSRITIDSSPQRPFPPVNADSNLMPIEDSVADGNRGGAKEYGSDSEDSMIAAVARRYRIQANSGQNPVAYDNGQEDFLYLLRNMPSVVGTDGLAHSSSTGAITTVNTAKVSTHSPHTSTIAPSSSQVQSSTTSAAPHTATCDDS